MAAIGGPNQSSAQSGQPSQAPRLFKPIKAVQIDGSVLLKLIKYCGEQSTSVSGRLLGLQKNNILEVTNCFAHYNNDFNNEMNNEILKLMDEIRQDNFIVGWYMSSINGNFLSSDFIHKQYQLQYEFNNCICIVYDPTFSKNGRLVIRGYRLTNKFMSFYKNEISKLNILSKTIKNVIDVSGKGINGPIIGPTSIGKFDINSNNIYEEISIQLHCTHLSHSFLFEIQKNKLLQCEFDRLHHKHSNSLLNNLKQLSNQIEIYNNETNNFRQFYNRCSKVKYLRENYAKQIELENKKLKSRGLRIRQMPDLEKLYESVPEQSRIDSVILNSQMNQYTKEVESLTMQGLAKLWITQGIHQNKQIDINNN